MPFLVMRIACCAINIGKHDRRILVRLQKLRIQSRRGIEQRSEQFQIELAQTVDRNVIRERRRSSVRHTAANASNTSPLPAR